MSGSMKRESDIAPPKSHPRAIKVGQFTLMNLALFLNDNIKNCSIEFQMSQCPKLKLY